jgi:hypothetical protein
VLGWLALCAIAVVPRVPAAAPPVATTPAVYAAFTLNLTRFITWPEAVFATRDAPFVIGTFAKDPINAELDEAVQGQSVNGHPIRTLRLDSPADVLRCHVVFVGAANGRHLAAVVQRAARRPILTVSDADGFLEMGGHVRFVPRPPHIALSISADNLKTSGLEARAQLLRLASLAQ